MYNKLTCITNYTYNKSLSLRGDHKKQINNKTNHNKKVKLKELTDTGVLLQSCFPVNLPEQHLL